MKHKYSLPTLSVLAVLLVSGTFMAPVFAWSSNISTTDLPSSVSVGTKVVDTAILQLTKETVPAAYNYGTITFKVFEGGTCTAAGVATSPGIQVWTSSQVTVTSASNGAGGTYKSPAWDTAGRSPGNYYFVAYYSGANAQKIASTWYPGYPSKTSQCEPLTLTILVLDALPLGAVAATGIAFVGLIAYMRISKRPLPA